MCGLQRGQLSSDPTVLQPQGCFSVVHSWQRSSLVQNVHAHAQGVIWDLQQPYCFPVPSEDRTERPGIARVWQQSPSAHCRQARGGPATGLAVSISGKKTQLGSKDRVAWQSPFATDPAAAKTLHHGWDVLTWIASSPPTWSAPSGVPCPTCEPFSWEEILSGSATISSLVARGLLGWFSRCFRGPGVWPLLVSLWWWPLAQIPWQIAPLPVWCWGAFPNV